MADVAVEGGVDVARLWRFNRGKPGDFGDRNPSVGLAPENCTNSTPARAWWGTWGPRRSHWHGSKRVCQAGQGSTPNLTSPYALRCSRPQPHHHPDFIIASPTQLLPGKTTPHNVGHRHNNAACMGGRSEEPASAQVETGRHSRPPGVPVVAIAVQLQGRDSALSASGANSSVAVLTQALAEEGCQGPESRPAKGADARGDGHAEAEEGLGGGAGPD